MYTFNYMISLGNYGRHSNSNLVECTSLPNDSSCERRLELRREKKYLMRREAAGLSQELAPFGSQCSAQCLLIDVQISAKWVLTLSIKSGA